MRSTTEELQTGKEELLSVNEELATVNYELKSNVNELTGANSDLQNLLTSTEIGTIFLDRQLCIKRFTPRVQELFNIIPSDVGRPLSDITHKLNQDGFTSDAERVLRELVTVERELHTPNGLWFMTRMLPYRTTDDHIDGVVLTFVDITARKQAEEALHESTARLHIAIEAAGLATWDWNIGTGQVHWNEQHYRIFGLEPGDGTVSYDEFMAFVHPGDRDELERKLEHSTLTTDVFQMEFRAVLRDGTLRWMKGYGRVVEHVEGRASHMSGVMFDITESRQAEEAMRESEERFRLLVEGTRDYAMFLLDTQRRIVHWNYGAERIFGYTREEALGLSGDIIFTDDDRAAGVPEHEAETAVKDGRAPDMRWHVRKDGSLFWAEGVNTSLRDEAGELRGFAKIARDATKERGIDEELRRAHDELESRVLERTAQLARTAEELRAEVAQRVQAEQAREQLLQRVVTTQEEERRRISRELHDQMGQQLTALLMGLKSLPVVDSPGAQPPSFDKRLDFLQNIADNLMQQMHRLAWELRPASLDTFGLEPALRQHVQEWSQHSGIEADFVMRGLPQDTRLPSDVEIALYRVVQEALTNVQRHSGARNVSVLLECHNNSVSAIIEDDGRGMESEPDLDGTTPARPTRLGLLGMQERMELVKGTLTIESVPGQGTTVYARAPFDRRSQPRD
jgi:PAS domain S-box-containing protein